LTPAAARKNSGKLALNCAYSITNLLLSIAVHRSNYWRSAQILCAGSIAYQNACAAAGYYRRMLVLRALKPTLVGRRSSSWGGLERRRPETRSINEMTLRASEEFKVVGRDFRGVDLDFRGVDSVVFFDAIASRLEHHAPAWRHSLMASSKLSA
jgi:hypothetical protein